MWLTTESLLADGGVRMYHKAIEARTKWHAVMQWNPESKNPCYAEKPGGRTPFAASSQLPWLMQAESLRVTRVVTLSSTKESGTWPWHHSEGHVQQKNTFCMVLHFVAFGVMCAMLWRRQSLQEDSSWRPRGRYLVQSNQIPNSIHNVHEPCPVTCHAWYVFPQETTPPHGFFFNNMYWHTFTCPPVPPPLPNGDPIAFHCHRHWQVPHEGRYSDVATPTCLVQKRGATAIAFVGWAPWDRSSATRLWPS